MKTLFILLASPVMFLSNLSFAQLSEYKPIESISNKVQPIANKQTPLAEVAQPKIVVNSIGLPLLNAEVKQDEVSLNWLTTSENKIDHFAILYSTDGSNWRELATIKAIGNLESGMSYRWSHSNPLMGTNYYQVQIVNNNGTVSYSDIAKATINDNTDNGSFVLYPNPNYNGVLKITDVNIKDVKILNSTGINVTSRTKMSTYSGRGGEIDISLLDAGVYYVGINGKVKSFVKN